MASRLDVRALAAWLAAVGLAALAWWFGSGVLPMWWMTWLAPLPILLLAPRTRARWAALAAFSAWTVGGLNQWHYLHDVIGLPMAVIIAAVTTPALVFTLCVLLFRRLLMRGQAIAAAVAMPLTFAAGEYLSSLLSPHGTFGNIGYTQMDALPVIQIAALAGIWGIGFLVLLFPATLAVLMQRQIPRGSRLTTAVMATLLIGASVTYGTWRLQAPAKTTARVGLVSLQKPIRPALAEADGRELLARYVTEITRLADDGAAIVVIPETSFATSDPTIPELAQLAQQHGLIIDAGVNSKQYAQRNVSMAFPPTSNSPLTYAKHHLIPGLERQYVAGDSYTLLDGTPRIGLAICKDMDFPEIGRAYAERGAQLLLVPAWDFGVDGWLHSRMAILRGVEGGFAVARVARSGRLTLSDDRGRVVAEASGEQEDSRLVGDLPLGETRTFYARWGDWFAWLDLLALAGLIVLAARAKKSPAI